MDTVYAYAYDDREGFPFPATHWYWQIGNMWFAVVRAWEPLDEWLAAIDHVVGPFNLSPPPEPCVYPIAELPPEGTLMYRDENGTIHQRELGTGYTVVRAPVDNKFRQEADTV